MRTSVRSEVLGSWAPAYSCAEGGAGDATAMNDDA
jgi:hypothetical protein